MSSFLLVCSAFISVIALVFQNGLLRLMNTPESAFSGAAEYSAVCMVGLIFIYGYNVVSAIMRGMGDSKHPFIFISIAAVINIVLDLVFVAWLGMGPFGAGLATVISQGVSFLLCAVFIYRNREKFGLDLVFRDFLIWNRTMLADLVKLGTPMAIKTASIQISKLFVNSFINSYSLEVSAFSGIANKLSSISNLVSAAMNTAGSTMVGQNIAAREFGRVKKILANLAVITLSVATVISVLICIFPTQIFGLFTTDADTSVLEFAHGYVPIAVLLFFGSAMRAIMNALLNGSGNYRINFATAILDGIVMRIGLAVLFGIALNMKHTGFWLGDAIAGFTPFFIGLVFYFTGNWKKGANKKRL
jgi:putative MATE family efflux protein